MRRVWYGKDEKRVTELLSKYSKSGKIPLSEVHDWYEKNKGIPIRTSQWYVQEEFIPAPSYEGRKGYYSLKDFKIVRETVYIIGWIKSSSKVKITRLKRVLKKYAKDRQAILNTLLNLVEEFPIYSTDDVNEEDRYDIFCDMLWKEVFDRLEKGVNLKTLKLTEIAEEVRKKIGQ